GVHREDRLSHPGRTDAVNPVLVNRYIGSLSTVSDKRRNGFARILLDAVKKSIATNLKQEHLFFTPILTLTTTRYRDSNLYQVFFKRKKILHVWLIVMTST
ncbi:hypothetical protein, partial [Aeromonas caviae]